jgi:hypothetical protein
MLSSENNAAVYRFKKSSTQTRFAYSAPDS